MDGSENPSPTTAQALDDLAARTLTIGMCLEGARVAEACVGDPLFMQKINWSGELVGRVYARMLQTALAQDVLAIGPRLR